jgi:DNA repair protein RadC
LLSLLATVLKPIDRDQVKSPHDIASYLQLKIGHECQEQFCVTCLNTRNRVQKTHVVYQGNVNTAIIRPGEAFREPIRLNSTAVIFSHVHPSGDPSPSPEDVLITRELVSAGKLLDIDVLDHLTIGQGKWISMRERNLGFDK